MSTENRMGNFQANQSMRASANYDFLQIQRDNIYADKKQAGSYARLEKLKQSVMKMVIKVDQGMASRGIAPPTSYLEDAYDF